MCSFQGFGLSGKNKLLDEDPVLKIMKHQNEIAIEIEKTYKKNEYRLNNPFIIINPYKANKLG